MKASLALAAIYLAATACAHAGPASDAVKFFYTPDKFVADAKYRDRFTTPVTGLFEKNDAVAKKNPDDVPCLDFDPALDAQDFDQKTVNKTLKLAEQLNGDGGTVTASFKLFPEGDDADRQMTWTMKKIDGKWKVADIASKTSNWTLSQLECDPDAAGQE
jgi:hypothetical protein